MKIAIQEDGRLPPMHYMVTEQQCSAALDWLRDNAAELGHAKARLVKAEHMVKHVEALEFQRSDAKSAEARKAEARTSAAYVDAINDAADAAGAYEALRAMREAAALKIEAWRTEQANFRSMKI